MKKVIYLGAATVIIVLAVFFTTNRNNQNVPQGKMVTGSHVETFSGTITAVDTGCFFDATCSVTVDGKKVILVTGGRAMASNTKVGKLVGVESIGDLEQKIGQHANVYATTTPDGSWSLYGDEKYYVEVIKVVDVK